MVIKILDLQAFIERERDDVRNACGKSFIEI